MKIINLLNEQKKIWHLFFLINEDKVNIWKQMKI